MTARRSFAILAAVWGLGTIVAVFGAFQARYNLSTVDGISYLSIARQYAEGQLDTAINAYWSPLVSWLAAPLIAAGVGKILAFDLVTAVGISIGAALLARLVWLRAGRHVILTLVVLGAFFVFALGNLPVLTPDMLVVTWMILWVSVLLEVDDRVESASVRGRIVLGVIIGVVGALGYVTKLYLVPVFAVTLIGWLILRMVRAPRGQRRAKAESVLTVLAIAAAALVLVSAPWVATLSAKYGTFMAGSSFSVNLEEKFDPDSTGAPTGPPVLYAPPNDNAVSFGEDRTAQTGDDTATAGTSRPLAERIVYYVTERVTAFPFYLVRIGSIAPFAVLTAAIVLVALVFGGRFRGRRDLALIGLTWGVYFLGYAAVTSAATRGGNSRYYWPLLVLALLLAAILVPELWRRFVAGRGRWRALIAVLLLALVPAGVVWQHAVGKGAPFSAEAPLAGVGYLVKSAQPMREATFAAESLAPLIPEGSKLVGSNYRATLRYAYYLHGQVYGRSAQGYRLDDPVFQGLMRDAGIDFYLRFTPVASEPADLGLAGVGYLVKSAQPMREATFAAESLAPLIPEGSKLVGSNYRVTLRYAYYLHGQVYGRSAQAYRLDDPVFQGLMRDAGIDFYLRFTPVASEPADLGGAGVVIGTFTEHITCTDEKLAVVEDCTIDVVQLGG